MKRIVILLVVMLAVCPLWAKKGYDGKGYKLVLTIEGNTDSVMYMGNYYAGGTYASDTARRDSKGRFVFERKDRRVFPGLYFFLNPAGRHVDFVIYHETPEFTFSTKDDDWTGNMKVKGSKENEIFFRFHHITAEIYASIDSAEAKKSDDEAFKEYRKEMMIMLDQRKTKLIEDNPNSFISLMMNATRDPEVPRVNENGDTLTRRQGMEYYMEHYFDHMRLDDDALVRTPEYVFKRRILDYLDRNLKGADAETLCHYIDNMMERARPSKEVFRWLVHTVTEKYLQSNVMSYDAVYVHMVKKYYASDENYWSSPSSIEMNMRRAEKWERLLLGKTAIDLVLKDDMGMIHQLHAQQHKYTLLIFWSPTCGHCKTIIPALYEKFLTYKDRCDIGAFAILSEPDDTTVEKWRDFVKEHKMTDEDWINLNGGEANIDWHDVYDIETTPQIYLLDKDKVFLAKKLNADTFEYVIKALEGME